MTLHLAFVDMFPLCNFCATDITRGGTHYFDAGKPYFSGLCYACADRAGLQVVDPELWAKVAARLQESMTVTNSDLRAFASSFPITNI